MVSAFAWHVREPRFDPQLGKIIICIFFISCYYLQSFSRELNCNNCLPDNTSSLMEESNIRFNSHIRKVFTTENHCCLSLSKCVNDKAEYKHRRLRGKSKMHTEYSYCPIG